MIKIEMTNKEAIRRLRDHFAIHDDGRPTPYLDEAERKAIEALEKVERLEVENKRLESKYEKLFSDFVAKASEYEQLKAENETLMQKNTNEYKLNEALLLRADRFEAERNELKFENEKLKSECNKYWCKADCNECDHRCRAWQNGYNAKQDIDGAIDKAIEALEFLYEVKNTKSDRS